MVVTVVNIESRSFSSAELVQHFRTENTRSQIITIENTCDLYVVFTAINYYKLAVEKDRDSVFTTMHYDHMETRHWQEKFVK